VRTSWSIDPYALGSYSYLAPSSVGDRIRALLAEPVGERLHFAGEATSSHAPATAHGALLSGWDAADTIADVAGAGDIVIVIGAGMAGLGCANRLQEHGINVTVLEARDRIGGRTWTDQLGSAPAELGAAWIHGLTGNPLTELVRATGGALYPFDYDNRVGENEVAERELEAILEQQGDVAGPFTTPLARLFPNPMSADLTVATAQYVQLDYAADPEELAVAALDEGDEFRGGDALLPDGYTVLVDDLAEGIDVRVRSEVTSVRYEAAGCEVALADGTSLTADHVVVTIPIGVLKAGTPSFEPALPDWKQRAIDQLGSGLLDKLWLTFDDVFWDAEVDMLEWSDPDRPGLWAAWVNGYKAFGQPLLCGFNGGRFARELAMVSDEEVVNSAMQALRGMYAG
jgi:monoamine oxidase